MVFARVSPSHGCRTRQRCQNHELKRVVPFRPGPFFRFCFCPKRQKTTGNKTTHCGIALRFILSVAPCSSCSSCSSCRLRIWPSHRCLSAAMTRSSCNSGSSEGVPPPKYKPRQDQTGSMQATSGKFLLNGRSKGNKPDFENKNNTWNAVYRINTHMAMGQNPVPPVNIGNIPIPTKIG